MPQAKIKDASISLPYPISDLVEKSKKIDDFSWLLRQLHHRYLTFEARQKEMNELTRSGKNLLYNVSQSPDTLLVIVQESVFGFELSRQYPSCNNQGTSEPMIKLLSAESAKPEVILKLQQTLKGNVSLTYLLEQLN